MPAAITVSVGTAMAVGSCATLPTKSTMATQITTLQQTRTTLAGYPPPMKWFSRRSDPPPPPPPPMKKRTAQDLYATLVKDLLSPAFRDLGFKGSSGRYSLPIPDHWALLGLQRSTYSTSAEVRFTINLLVVSKASWELQRQESPYLPQRPSASMHYSVETPQRRIGQLRPDGQDKWWGLSSRRQLEVVAAEVIHDVREYALPWMKGV